MSYKKVIVIPARYASSRFPGKPLVRIKGHRLIYRVWSIAKAVQGIDEVYIATDHAKIQHHAREFGANVVMTTEHHNGTERCFAALSGLDEKPDLILNLQGDAVLTPPWILQTLVESMVANRDLDVATPATRINSDQYAAMHEAKLKGEVGGTMVVCDKALNAMYFSKRMIPYLRDTHMKGPPLYRHIGLYAYRYAALRDYYSRPVTPLEQLEGLEQLRWLENGQPIKIVLVDYKGRTTASIDSPDDVMRVERLIETQGECVPL